MAKLFRKVKVRAKRVRRAVGKALEQSRRDYRVTAKPIIKEETYQGRYLPIPGDTKRAISDAKKALKKKGISPKLFTYDVKRLNPDRLDWQFANLPKQIWRVKTETGEVGSFESASQARSIAKSESARTGRTFRVLKFNLDKRGLQYLQGGLDSTWQKGQERKPVIDKELLRMGKLFADAKAKNPMRRKKNIPGFYDSNGVFHPIRDGKGYSESAVGSRTRSKRRRAQRAKASATADRAGRAPSASATAKKSAATKQRKKTGKQIARSKSASLLKSRASKSLASRTATGKRLKKRNTSVSAKFAALKPNVRAVYRLLLKELINGETTEREFFTALKHLEIPRSIGLADIKASKGTKKKRNTTINVRARHVDFAKTHNPKRAAKAKTRRNPGASKDIARQKREQFTGRKVSKWTSAYAPVGSGVKKGEHVALLGALNKIKIKGRSAIDFKGAAHLAQTKDGRLVVLGKYRLPQIAKKNPAGNVRLGVLDTVEYIEKKSHLGDQNKVIYFHHHGENGGKKPTVFLNREGLLVLKGGDYKITSAGIEG